MMQTQLQYTHLLVVGVAVHDRYRPRKPPRPAAAIDGGSKGVHGGNEPIRYQGARFAKPNPDRKVSDPVVVRSGPHHQRMCRRNGAEPSCMSPRRRPNLIPNAVRLLRP